MRGFTVSGARATISPVARRSNSFRISCAAPAASGAVSGLTTSWKIPVWSRRSTNTSPPWSRRRAAQPARVTRRPASVARGSPQPRSRQGIDDLLVADGAIPLAPPPERDSLGADEERHARAEPFRLRELPLRRAAGVVGVGADAVP